MISQKGGTVHDPEGECSYGGNSPPHTQASSKAGTSNQLHSLRSLFVFDSRHCVPAVSGACSGSFHRSGRVRCCCTAALMLISWSASAPLSPALYSRCSASGTGSTKHCTAPSPRMLQTRLPPKASLTTSSALHALLPHTFLHTPKRLCRFSRQSLFPFNQKQHAETERRAVFSGSMVICPTCRTRR